MKFLKCYPLEIPQKLSIRIPNKQVSSSQVEEGQEQHLFPVFLGLLLYFHSHNIYTIRYRPQWSTGDHRSEGTLDSALLWSMQGWPRWAWGSMTGQKENLFQSLWGMPIALLSMPWNHHRRRGGQEALAGHFAVVSSPHYRFAAPAIKCTSANPEHRDVILERCTLYHSGCNF